MSALSISALSQHDNVARAPSGPRLPAPRNCRPIGPTKLSTRLSTTTSGRRSSWTSPSQFETRFQSLMAYKSQFSDQEAGKDLFPAQAEIRSRLEAMARFYGMLGGVTYAEPFLQKEVGLVEDSDVDSREVDLVRANLSLHRDRHSIPDRQDRCKQIFRVVEQPIEFQNSPWW